MALNDDKCHPKILGNTKNDTTIKIGNAEIKESYSDELLGITFDKKLRLKKHIKDLCKIKLMKSSTHLLEYLIS